MEFQILRFIKENPTDWEQQLTSPPFCLKVSRQDNLVLFKYGINSDWRDANARPLLEECRGLVVKVGEQKTEVVHLGLRKFFNLDEPLNEVKPHFPVCRVLQKVDGSCVAFWNANDQWHMSSLSCIDARTAIVNGNLSLYEIAAKALGTDPLRWATLNLNPLYSYVFELTSPFNRVVVDYGDEAKLWRIMKRNTITWREAEMEALPRTQPIPSHSFSTEIECRRIVEQMDDNEEGYVIVNPDFSRVKLKSPAYVAKHIMANNGKFSLRNYVEMRQNHTIDDFIAAFPQHTSTFKQYEAAFQRMKQHVSLEFSNHSLMAPRDIAAGPLDPHTKAYILARLNGRCKNVEEWFNGCFARTQIKILEGFMNDGEN